MTRQSKDAFFNHLRCGTAVVVAGLLAGTAVAEPGAADAPPGGAADAPPAAPEGFGDIVVTATRRSEALSKVPVSISAFNQQSLDQRGIRTIEDLARQTPGLNIGLSSGSVGGQRAAIRGIDSTAGAATTATYIDDTPVQSRNSALNYSLSTFPRVFDLDRVEVLRGPQGTLFGASSMGGAIRFITPSPSLDSLSVYARSSVSTIDGGGVSGEIGAAVGAPIVEDKVGFRVSGWYQHEAGWVDRTSYQNSASSGKNVNSSNTEVVHGALTLKPAEWLTITPSVYYQNQKIADTSFFWESLSDPHAGVYKSGSSIPQPSHDRFVLPSLKVGIDAGSVMITSVTSHYRRDVNEIRDQTQTNDLTTFGVKYLFPVVNGYKEVIDTWYSRTHQRDWVQELRFQNNSSNSRFNWIAGIYYSHSNLYSDPDLNSAYLNDFTQQYFGKTVAQYFGTGLVDGLYRYTGRERTIEKQIAGYVNVDWHIVKGFTLTAGGRYSRNTLDFNITEKSPTYVGGVSTNNGRIKEKPFTPKVSLSYEPSDRTLLYATYARGFRTGGVNKTVPLPACQSDLTALGFSAQPKDYSSDTTDSYEVGAKGRLFGNVLRVEASGFQINWNNIQQQIRLTCAYPIVLNTGKARSRGFDLNIVLHPARGFEFGAAVGYDKAIYLQTIQTGAKATVFAGQKLPIAPWTVNSFAEYHFSVADHDSFVRIQDNFTGRNKGPFPYQNPITTAYDPAIRPSEAINQVDLRAGIKLGKLTWEVFSQNLFNDHPILDRAALFAGSPFRTERTIRPRTIGAMVTLSM